MVNCPSAACSHAITDMAVHDGVMFLALGNELKIMALVDCSCRAFSSAAVHIPRSSVMIFSLCYSAGTEIS